MKLLFAVHGYPPELTGGTEVSVQALARGLARAGHAVTIVAGSIAPSQRKGEVEVEEALDVAPDGTSLRVLRVRRPDLYFDHWHKSLSPAVARAFRGIVREVRPELVHVHHWIRLSRDLVLCSARERVPAVVTLHDLWTSCLIAFRVRPDTRAFCEAVIGPHPCIACAAQLAPRTPWVKSEGAFMLLGERQRDLGRELDLARALIAPSAAHAQALARFLGRAPEALAVQVIPPLAIERFEARAPFPSPSEMGRLKLVAFGQLAEHKGTDLLFDALRRLPDDVRVELHMLGGSSARRDGTPWSDAAVGLDVRFHGPYVPAELRDHPALDAHAFVSATRAHESYGLVLDEARLLGLPAVLPRAGAFEERAQGGGVVWFESGDAGSLAAALERLARETGLLERLREETLAARASVPREADVIRAHEAVYARAIARGAPDVAAESWFEARLASEALAEWDRALARRSAEDLGLSASAPRGPGAGA